MYLVISDTDISLQLAK